MNVEFVPRVIHSLRDLEPAVYLKQQAILSSYHQNCPGRMAVSPRMVPLWNKGLRCHKASTRQLFNQALTCYTKEIRKTNGHLGETTVGGSRISLTGPDS